MTAYEMRISDWSSDVCASDLLSPFNAWVVLKGLETLDLRARRQSENALAVGKAIEGRVARMLHPGLASHPPHELAMSQMEAAGQIFAFELPGGSEQAMTFLNALAQIGTASRRERVCQYV